MFVWKMRGSRCRLDPNNWIMLFSHWMKMLPRDRIHHAIARWLVQVMNERWVIVYDWPMNERRSRRHLLACIFAHSDWMNFCNMLIGWISSRRHLLTSISRQFYRGHTVYQIITGISFYLTLFIRLFLFPPFGGMLSCARKFDESW